MYLAVFKSMHTTHSKVKTGKISSALPKYQSIIKEQMITLDFNPEKDIESQMEVIKSVKCIAY